MSVTILNINKQCLINSVPIPTVTPNPLVDIVLKEGTTNVYIITTMVYAQNPLYSISVDGPAVTTVKTEAGDVQCRAFSINMVVLPKKQTTSFSLWKIEIEYQLDEGTESLPCAYVTQFTSVLGALAPDTPRGTVTTPADPLPPGNEL